MREADLTELVLEVVAPCCPGPLSLAIDLPATPGRWSGVLDALIGHSPDRRQNYVLVGIFSAWLVAEPTPADLDRVGQACRRLLAPVQGGMSAVSRSADDSNGLALRSAA